MAKPDPKLKSIPKIKSAAENLFSAYEKYFIPLVLGLTFLCLLPTLQNKFVNLDDPQYLVENPVVQEINSDNLKTIFSEQFVGNYQPITMLVYMAEYSIFDGSPSGYHLVNLLFHLLSCFFVFLITKHLSKNALVAFLTALLFGIHPLHVESVAWISELKDVLYGFFFLWALYLYITGIASTKKGEEIKFSALRTSAILLLFLLSLLSKAQAVVLPIVFFAVDFIMKRELNKKTILEKVSFFLLAIAFGVLAIQVQGKAGAMQTFQYFPVHERLLFSCYALMTYLHKLLAPINLSCFYPYPETDDKINTVWVYLSPVILLALAGIIWKYFRDSMVFVFGTGFFLITIILVLQLLPIGDALYADRYTYLPSIGVFFIAAHYLAAHLQKKLVIILTTVYLVWLGFATFNRSKVWHDSISLYSDAINRGYQAAIIYNNRGAVLADSSRNEEALVDFNSLVKLKPRYPNAWKNKGLIEVRLGLKDSALKSFSLAIEQSPTGTANYLSRGTIYVEQNEFEKALIDFTKIIELTPTSGEGYYARSEAYGKSNRLTEALADINKAIEYSPDNGQAYNNRGIILSMSSKFPEAVADFTKSLELKLDNYSAYTNRALSYKGMGKYNLALQDMLTAQKNGVAVDENIILELNKLIGELGSPKEN